jgi:putative addiction module antidote
MTTAHVTNVGASLGIAFPKEVVEKLNLTSGDQLCLIETPNGVEITTLPPKQAEQLQLGRQIIVENQEALRALAK